MTINSHREKNDKFCQVSTINDVDNVTTVYDTVIVGSGIAGSSLARDLTKAEQRVLLVEKGGHHRYLGNHLAVLRIADKKGFRYTKEHLMIASGTTMGGSSVISAGTAFRPPRKVFQPWGIDLERELDESEKETGATILSDELIGQGNLHLLKAGNQLGYDWIRLPKFIDSSKCVPNCSACMLGCKRVAKFTARRLIEEAISQGLQIQKKNIDHVVVEGGKAMGVKPKRGHILRADRIIISAGGIHSPIILQKTGIKNAGQGFFMDPMIFTYGVASEKAHRTIHDMPMAVGTFKFYDEEGILHSPVVDPWGIFLISFLYQKNPLKVLRFRHYSRLMGIMSKIQDGKKGTISQGRLGVKISKKLTEEDQNRLEKGNSLAKEVIIEAGSKSKHVFSTPIRGAHPGGTNSIGQVVDSDLKTNIPNLFVCDASILPRSLGSPLVLTIMAFAKRLSSYILREY
ncbi:MAG: GMC family oxidoreductase [Candidatus Heimdallarchaeota archaeon]|nr:MAG: GMC family oxidoreductase [Candidatus Heimdallarchaeota archaeon]